MRKHLHWSRDEFLELSDDDQRIYREGLIHYITGGKSGQHSSSQPPPGIVRRRIQQDLSHLRR